MFYFYFSSLMRYWLIFIRCYRHLFPFVDSLCTTKSISFFTNIFHRLIVQFPIDAILYVSTRKFIYVNMITSYLVNAGPFIHFFCQHFYIMDSSYHLSCLRSVITTRIFLNFFAYLFFVYVSQSANNPNISQLLQVMLFLCRYDTLYVHSFLAIITKIEEEKFCFLT